MISASGPPLSFKCCIYKVPRNIYHGNVAAYEPYVVSIGPFHHGESNLKDMEEHKLNIELSSKYFVQMILVDGVFIVELFLRAYFSHLQEDSDHLSIFNPGFLNAITHDLILLENQLPFFVLERILDLAFPCMDAENLPTMLDLTFAFFLNYNTQKMQPGFEVKHLLDLLRTFQPPSNSREETDKVFEFLPRATELHKAGVKFKKVSSGCLLDIHFQNYILKIPCLKLYNKTESYFRNLMAFEQCHYPYDSCILDFVFLMDYLINTTEDVDLLIQSGVIVNWLGDAAAVATPFNNLSTNLTVVVSNFYFVRLSEDLNAYCSMQSPLASLEGDLQT
ncbi:Protein of unknown function DUF247, plant [Dillenia turbinata]|uniref:Uncharacterized protein n=1 Tax=Dillenia turbinata TaxID=194707 RepID=A0AAN8Z7A4_9MAGN